MNIAFTGIVLYINYRGLFVSDVLVGSWFSFTTAELWGLAFIKGKEIKHSGDECEEDLKGEDLDG